MTFKRPAQETAMGKLLGALPRAGEVVWIGLRPARRAPMRVVSEAEARPGEGLVGDRFSGTPDSIRQVTLIQAEHLPAVASLAGLPEVDPALLRRNLVIKGINLLALKEQRFWVGEALLETTGLCHPCSRMEEALGEGGYNAVRGHGGITARVLRGGPIRLGDAVSVEKEGMPNRAV